MNARIANIPKTRGTNLRAALPYRLLGLIVLLALGVGWAQPQVRVLLDDVTGEFGVAVSGPHRGYVDGSFRFETALGLRWPLEARDGVLWSGDIAVGRQFSLEPTGDHVDWQGVSYRGALRFLARGDTVRVINVLSLEDYLRGVVPSEMQASWPLEALKAQAVASRTYTVASLQPGEDYDICATQNCQVYRGTETENPRSDQAIADTAGLVLTYGSQVARTYYHSDSGGYTASSAEVWGYSAPYLVARSDVSGASPFRQWVARLEPSLIARSLRERGFDVGTVTALRVLAVSESGRVERIGVEGSQASVELGGASLHPLLRSWGLRSTRFSMQGALSVRGDGWGHGVGMSQYGARTLAEQRYSFAQILAFYYPNTQLQTFSERY